MMNEEIKQLIEYARQTGTPINLVINTGTINNDNRTIVASGYNVAIDSGNGQPGLRQRAPQISNETDRRLAALPFYVTDGKTREQQLAYLREEDRHKNELIEINARRERMTEEEKRLSDGRW